MAEKGLSGLGKAAGAAEGGASSGAGDSRQRCRGFGQALRQYRSLLPLAAAQMFLLADQPLLPVNMSSVAEEFGMHGAERDEKLGGTVAVVFFSTGAVASLLAGRLADVAPRRWLLAFFLLVGGGASFVNSGVAGYLGLLGCRAAAGVAIGGVIPVIFSILGDLYAADKRPEAIALLTVIAGLGPTIGQALAGFLGPAVGWRVPFTIVGVATFAFGLALPWLMAEDGTAAAASRKAEAGALPATGTVAVGGSPASAAAAAAAAAAGTASTDVAAVATAAKVALSDVRQLLATRTVLLVFLQGITGCVPWAVINTFLTDYLAVDSGLGVSGATAVMFSFGTGVVIGTIAGGRLGRYLYGRSKRLQPALMAVTVFGGAVPLLALVALPAGSPLWLFHALAFLGGSQAAASGGNAKAVLLNTSAPEMRGIAFGIYSIMDDLGKGCGPAFVSRWVRQLGRTASFLLGISCWVPCAAFCLLACLTVAADEAALQRKRQECGHAEIGHPECQEG